MATTTPRSTYQSTSPNAPGFFAWAPSSRRTRYQSEYNNPNTSATRKSAIDKVWQFSFDPKKDMNLYNQKQTEWQNEKNTARKQAMAWKWGFTDAPPASPQPQAPQPEAPPVDTTALFPSIRAFEPQSYEGSPLYQFQKTQGLKSLERLYNARGLTGSGAEIEGNTGFLNQLGANEAQRAGQVAQTEADRFMNLLTDTANRKERAGNEQWDRLYGTLGLALNQSPFNNLYNSAVASSGNATNLGNSAGGLYSTLASLLQAPPAGAFATPGGGSTPAAFPSSPNTSSIDQLAFQGQQSSQNQWLNFASQLAGYLLK